MRCLACKYDLRRLISGGEEAAHRCPECGRAFDPRDPRTFDNQQPRMIDRLKRQVLIAGLVLLLFFALVGAALYYMMRSVLGGEYW